MPSDATRDSLLDAAKRVMQRDGAGNLTLDAVAREAGVSKGGLLYHFPSKGELLRGLVASGGDHMRRDLEAAMRLAPGPQSFARAFLRLSVFGPPDPGCKPSCEAIRSMLGASANDPTLLTPIQASQAEWSRRLADDGVDDDVARLIQFVGRGLWMTEILGLDAPTPAGRQRLYDLIARLGGLEAPTHNDKPMEEN